jgi:bidirectional [NiFe] hydrogenase diaphorase subunit
VSSTGGTFTAGRARRPPAPSDDERWQAVDARMRRLGYRAEAVVEALHAAQEAFGYISPEALGYISDSLRVPPSRVYGTATFYHFFRLRPPGEHEAVVCTGTACYIFGAGQMVDTVGREMGVAPKQTTPDGRLTLDTARCIGACSLAPAAIVDGEVIGRLRPDELVERLREL